MLPDRRNWDLSKDNKRTINLDPGYLNEKELVLASFKKGTNYYLSFDAQTSLWSVGTTHPGLLDNLFDQRLYCGLVETVHQKTRFVLKPLILKQLVYK